MALYTAYIDMEFAGIYGTRQGMQIPIEIGVVICRTDMDGLSFFGKAFKQPVDVELWKNVTDDLGKRIDGQRRVFNLASPGRSREFDRKFRLDAAGRRAAYRQIGEVHRDLRDFMQALNQKDIGTLVFFAGRREMETFRHSHVTTIGFLIRDLQEEIRSRFRLREHVSLDRAALVAGISIDGSAIRSSHLCIPVPEKYRHLMKPHKAIGDAARILLVDRESYQFPDQFGQRLTGHIDEYERRKTAGKSPLTE